MSDTTRSTPACDLSGIREAVCVHTDKITDSCLAKDCIEDLHVYLTVESQCTLDKAVSAKARFVELMHVAIQLDPVPYSAGYYTVDITYYYRVIADAVMQAGRPCTITGLAVFSKRLVLFGGETTARIYSSRSYKNCLCKKGLQEASAPEAIVEIVDPMILGSRVQEVCACNCWAADIPQISESDIVITSVRHYSALLHADESLQRVIDSMNLGLSGDLLAEDLRMVIDSLAEITGEERITPQETLNSIFSSYCIGK